MSKPYADLANGWQASFDPMPYICVEMTLKRPYAEAGRPLVGIDVVKQRILDRVPLGDLIGKSVELTLRSGRQTGLCPFHDEKSPSFTLYDTHYHCFGCQAHGDAIDFVRKSKGLGFIEALRFLGESYQIDVSELDQADKSYGEAKKLSVLYQVMAAAAKIFQDQLHSEQGGKAREYLAARGFSPEQMKEYGFGLAFDRPDGLIKALRVQGYQDADIQAVSLCSKTRRGLMDFFIHRIMIPIHDRHGRVIAFGGRTLGDDPAKYKNSREHVLFHKGRTLFGIHQASAAIRKNRRALLVEGYMDALVLWSHGIQEVVACMGTALGSEQLKILEQMTPKLYLLFDGDQAGRTANLRTVQQGFEVPKLEIKVGLLPDKEDPDSFLRHNDVNALEDLLSNGKDLLNHAIEQKLRSAHGLDIPHLIEKELVPWIRQAKTLLHKSFLINKLSELSGVEATVIQNMVLQKKPPPPPSPKPPEPEAQEKLVYPSRLEIELLGHMYFSRPDEIILEGLNDWLKNQLTWHPVWQELARDFIVCLLGGQKPAELPLTAWSLASHQEVLNLLERLVQKRAFFDVSEGQSRNELILRVKKAIHSHQLKDILNHLKEELAKLESSGQNPAEQAHLLREIIKTNQKLRKPASNLAQPLGEKTDI